MLNNKTKKNQLSLALILSLIIASWGLGWGTAKATVIVNRNNDQNHSRVVGLVIASDATWDKIKRSAALPPRQGAAKVEITPQRPMAVLGQKINEPAAANKIDWLKGQLKNYGFDKYLNGQNREFDQNIKNAVSEFQKAVGLNPVGLVGPRTKKALNGEEFITNAKFFFNQSLRYGDQNTEVKELQTRLKDLGYFPYQLASTGYFGSLTQKSLKEFQKNNGLESNGIFDAQTIDKLNLFSK